MQYRTTFNNTSDDTCKDHHAMAKSKTKQTQRESPEGDSPVTSNNLQGAIKKAAHRLAQALGDASELKVETRYVLTDTSAQEASDERGILLARTTMQLDGDAEVLLPMQRDDAGKLITDREIFELHAANVRTALDYRTNLLTNLLRATSLS